MKELIFVSLTLFCTQHVFAFEGDFCKFLFLETPAQESLFLKVESLEDSYKELLITATTSYGKLKDHNLTQSLDKLVSQIQDKQKALDTITSNIIEEKVDNTNLDLFVAESNFKSLKQNLNEMLQINPEKRQKYKWSDITEDPQLLKPYKLYTTDSQGDIPIKVRFSSRILDELFYSNQPIDQIAAKKILKALTRFVANNDSRSSGLVELKASKGIYEVRIVGHTVGAIRVAGIKKDGIIHFVHMDRHSNHNATFANHLAQKALSKFEHDFN